MGEPERPRVLAALYDCQQVLISAVSRYEALVVLHGKRMLEDPQAEVDGLLARIGAQIIPFDADQSSLAFQAYARFGKGSGSPARLNLADCAAYALAARTGAPLLFTGADFAHTDLQSA